MKMLVVLLFFLASLVTSYGQEVKKLNGINGSVVCIEKKKTLGLTIIRGEHGDPGLRGLKGETGQRGFPGSKAGFYTGPPGFDGRNGAKGVKGDRGDHGYKGLRGPPGSPGSNGPKGFAGETGSKGPKGFKGELGFKGEVGHHGADGPDGLPRPETTRNMVIHALNDYQVTQSGFYNNIYHVKSRDLTDGRSDTGGWGSETPKIGNFIQAIYARPVYATSVTVAGGFIPSWGNDVKRGYGNLALEYSSDGRNWRRMTTFPSPVAQELITVTFRPVTAQYWRLLSMEDKWVGTTEFALKPLIMAA
ncbi:collectin-12-like [Dendronephthya gigantea]|uniref:collectin-12-like n=1 Tax=Dendronephthya gigantea TaxID=151771 RepID=UPI00106D657A|nr:collectin-12-like [Dendronephthya gigantea]